MGVSPASSIFYQYDGLGSVRSITDESGDLQETYDYDAYGTLIGLAKRNPSTSDLDASDPLNQAVKPNSEHLYTGEQWDGDLGMYFLRARYLNTNTGRFHTQDSYEGQNSEPLTLHKYLYANGNPVMMMDPSGNFSLGELSLVLGFQSNEKNSDAQRTDVQKKAFTKTPYAEVRFGVGSGAGSPGKLGVLIGHAFIFAELLNSSGTGLKLDANPDVDYLRRNRIRNFRKAAVTGILGISIENKKDLDGKLIGPGIKLSILQHIIWLTLTKAEGSSLVYKFYSIPGGSTVNCYTWAAEAFAKAILVKTIIR